VPVLRVYDLPFSKFQLAAPLLRQAWFDEAYIEMVLEGIQPGRIFVDRLDHPAAALLCHPYEFYIAGDCSPGSPLRQFTKDNPAEPDIFHTLYGYCGVSPAWETALVEDSGGLLKPVPRRNFKFRRPTPLLDWRAFIPPHAALKRIDASLALQVDRDFHQSISRYWGKHQNFLERSYGFCLLVDGQVASLVDVPGISSHYANFSVVTAEAYRRQGSALLTCTACIEHTLEQGLIPTWDTDGTNLASAALALKLGFEEEAPFNQLSPDDPRNSPLQYKGSEGEGGKLAPSRGVWSEAGMTDGIVTWVKLA
jgi:RimJ/RimL family protein N-acetyltransferase